MTRTTHTLFIGTMSAIVVVVTVYLSYVGWSYYQLPLEERFYHPQHNWFKPSGAYGHGIGILGTFLILFGVVIYIARKRYNFMTKQLRLKYLLEFHIFLCTLGPILILFHTAFKFGGLVSVAFWSMVAVVASGVIGRFIYIQIPRTVEGRELSLNEVKGMRAKLVENLKQSVGLDEQLIPLIVGTTDGEGAAAKRRSFISRYLDERKAVGVIRSSLKAKNMAREEQASIIRMVKEEFALSHRIGRLLTMQKLFKYWHVAHLPFALIMLIVLIIHVAVTLSFGYKWIF
ncbi:MAG: hypothetical protein IPG10_14780 [Flavobacteriales bacterium]|nr:hypothetical protein [Flavobacteriales bacterium]MBK6755900.1 hypothetical protein [Flavobacteriales bacterium]MBK7084872.1 hypothetical protein [Flavobacteriales bacterium]MBK7270565.1 hypothetical protein [Flavobacteriales bacterium]MBK7751573.1 hypothetical protein [Flavobacteriales bacterium]